MNILFTYVAISQLKCLDYAFFVAKMTFTRFGGQVWLNGGQVRQFWGRGLTVIIMVSFIINFNKIIIIPKKSRLESGEYGCKASNSEGEGFSRPFALTVQRKLHAVHTSTSKRKKL